MQRKEPVGALHYLDRAFATSPDSVQATPVARGVAADLVRTAKGPLKTDVMRLADQIGILV